MTKEEKNYILSELNRNPNMNIKEVAKHIGRTEKEVSDAQSEWLKVALKQYRQSPIWDEYGI